MLLLPSNMMGGRCCGMDALLCLLSRRRFFLGRNQERLRISDFPMRSLLKDVTYVNDNDNRVM